MLSTAQAYANSGLSVIPTKQKTKRPAIKAWKQFQQEPPGDTLLTKWFKDDGNLCLAIITGAVSGNLELLDFDFKGELAKAWGELVPEELRNKLVAEQSQSGGWHLIYRCIDPIPGNLKLAQRGILCDGPEGIEINGKVYKAVKKPDGNFYAVVTMIETRGEGGYFLAAPSPGYVLRRNDFATIPLITSEERKILINAATSVNEWKDPILDEQPHLKLVSDRLLCDGPGDDYNARGDVLSLLTKHGWQTAGKSGVTPDGVPTLLVTRPGKAPSEHSGSLIDGRSLYVWSTNASPFESEKSYSPFAIYANLECGGDYSTAAKELSRQGYGKTTHTFDDLDEIFEGQRGTMRDREGQEPCLRDNEGQEGQMRDRVRDRKGQESNSLYSNACAPTQKKEVKSVIVSQSQNQNKNQMDTKSESVMTASSQIIDILKKHGIDENQLQETATELAALGGAARSTCKEALQVAFRDWVMESDRVFKIADFFHEAGIVSRKEKRAVHLITGRMKDKKEIAPVGNNRGVFRKIEDDLDILDWETASDVGIPIWLPFGIDKLVNILPGNIIAFAGVQNAGKTGLLMETAVENSKMGTNVRYCSSEMGQSELKGRIRGFARGSTRFSMSSWKDIEFVNRSTNFPDILLRGEGNITIIDFMEIHEEFYRMGGMIRDLHDNLDGGVCIMALQKNPGAASGRGGSSSQEKPRLYVNVEKTHIEIVKAKNRKTEFNPNGQCKRFEPGAGGRLIEKSGWYPKEG